MRRLLLVLVLLVGLAAVTDRVAALGAERIVSERIQAEEGLAVRPDVSIGGFPFLTQAFEGRYDDVTVRVRDLRRGGLVVHDVRAHLSGVHVPLLDVVRQRVNRIHVDKANGDVDLDYVDVNRLLADKHVRLGPGPDGDVHVSASGTVAGVTASVSTNVPISVQGETLVMDAGHGITLDVPLPSMPFGIRLESAKAMPDGIVVVCSANGLVFHD